MLHIWIYTSLKQNVYIYITWELEKYMILNRLYTTDLCQKKRNYPNTTYTRTFQKMTVSTAQLAGLALTAMFIMVGTLMVRALRPLAKDHKELEHVEPEVTGTWPTTVGDRGKSLEDERQQKQVSRKDHELISCKRLRHTFMLITTYCYCLQHWCIMHIIHL